MYLYASTVFKRKYLGHYNLFWAEAGCVATLLLQSYNHLSTFKSGKLHIHLKHEIYAWLQSLHLTLFHKGTCTHSILLPKAMVEFFVGKETAFQVSTWFILQKLQCLDFTKRNNDYKKETKIKAAFSCKSDGITYKSRKCVEHLHKMRKLQGQSKK